MWFISVLTPSGKIKKGLNENMVPPAGIESRKHSGFRKSIASKVERWYPLQELNLRHQV